MILIVFVILVDLTFTSDIHRIIVDKRGFRYKAVFPVVFGYL